MFKYQIGDSSSRVLNQITWGAHINSTNCAEFLPKYPDWLNHLQKQEWLHRGLVVWDVTIQVVAHIYANYALKILETMKETDTWESNNFVIGSPAYRISVPDTRDEQIENKSIEHPKDGWVLTNQITLSSEQAEALLKFMVAEEGMLTLIADDEDRDVRDACAMVVDLLVESGMKKRELKENGTRDDPPQKKIIPISLSKGEYLTIPQMARVCNVSVKQIKKWIRSGDMEVIELTGAGQIVEIGKFNQFLSKRKPSGSHRTGMV